VEWKALVCKEFGWTPAELGRQRYREVLEVWLALSRLEIERESSEKRWQLLLAQLSIPPGTKEAALLRQRLFRELWFSLSRPKEPESLEAEKQKFQRVFGFPFVRKSKKT